MPSPDALLPLKDLVFRILVTLGEGERHGWGIAQALAESGGGRVLPGHLYRTLDAMLDLALINEHDKHDRHDERDEHDERGEHGGPAHETPRTGRRGAAPTRFFQLTTFGRRVAEAETARLETLIARSRAAGFAKAKGR